MRRSVLRSTFDKKKLPAVGSGAMCYMLSKQGHWNEEAGTIANLRVGV